MDQYASKGIDTKTLDTVKINAIRSFLKTRPNIAEDINNWVLIANRELIPSLLILAKFINTLSKHKPSIIYRGNRLSGGFGETLDLRKPKVGSSYIFNSKNRAVSFTKDIAIARYFGETVVRYKVKSTDVYLDLIPELCFVISNDLRNIVPETQDEVILLPPFNINFEVVEINKKLPIWLSW